MLAYKNKLEIDIKNSSKPKEVYLNYKNLANKSIRDDSILQSLEKQTNVILEKAKVENPWELITSPTLKNSISGKKINCFQWINYRIIFFFINNLSL